jgi:hypothetical protein
MYFVSMKQLVWNEDKNRLLKAISDRAVSFDDIAFAIENGGLLDDIRHINSDKYPNQRMFVVLFNSYIYCVPYVNDGEQAFLKTIYPSRKLMRKYLSGDENA